MNLLFVSPRTPEPITALTSAAGMTFVAHGTTIATYKRGKEVNTDKEIIFFGRIRHSLTLVLTNILI